MSVRWGTLAASALLLALLLGAQSLRIHHDEERTEPIAASGAASSPVDAESFTAEVVDVSFASAVAEEDPFDFDAGADAGAGAGAGAGFGADPESGGSAGGADGTEGTGGTDGSAGAGGAEEPGEEGIPAPAEGAAEAVEANGVWVVVTVDITAARQHLDRVEAELDGGGDVLYSHNTWLSSALGSPSSGFPAGIPVRGSVLFEVPPGQLTAPVLRLNAFAGIDRRLSGLAEIDLELSGSDLRSAVDGAETALSVPPAAQQEV